MVVQESMQEESGKIINVWW